MENLEEAEHRLDPPAIAIAPLVEADLAGAGSGNNHTDALLSQLLAQPVGVVALVGDQPVLKVLDSEDGVVTFKCKYFAVNSLGVGVELQKYILYDPKILLTLPNS